MRAHEASILMFLVCCFAPAALPAPIAPLERQECRDDYHQFCRDYGLDSPGSTNLHEQGRSQPVERLRRGLDSGGRS
jgi:hypothetical protein